MKVYTKNGVLTAEAESVEDVLSIITFQKRTYTKSAAQIQKESAVFPPKRKKHAFSRACVLCGKSQKGNQGMSTHVRRSHHGKISKNGIFEPDII